MKLSIITAFHYSEKFILDNILSVNEQTYRNIEHIFIGKDLKDPTISIIKNFSNRQPKILMQDKSGIYNAFNKAIQNYSGDILLYLNSDDWLYSKNIINDVCKLFDKNNLDLLYGDVFMVSRFYPFNIKRKYDNNIKFSKIKFPPHPAFFARRNIIDKIGLFNENLTIASDYDFINRAISISNNIYYLKKTITIMRIGGVSTGNFFKHFKGNIQSFYSIYSKYNFYKSFIIIVYKILIKIPQFKFFNKKQIYPPSFNLSAKNNFSCSIVIYNTSEKILNKTINSILESNFKDISLFIVDNSKNFKLNFLLNKKINYLFLNQNLGFGKAHNIVIDRLKFHNGFHLFLNPDVYFDKNFIKKYINYNLKNNINCSIPRIFYPNNIPQRSYRNFPTLLSLFLNFFNDYYEISNVKKKVECPSGCFIFCKYDLIKKINGFDEKFFLYFEDIDLFRRIHQITTIYYLPNFKIFHHFARESRKNIKLTTIHLFSLIKYFLKW